MQPSPFQTHATTKQLTLLDLFFAAVVVGGALASEVLSGRSKFNGYSFESYEIEVMR